MSAACKKPFKRQRTNKIQSLKTKFRNSGRWTKFRRRLKARQVYDPVTGAELGPNYTVHHLDMDADNYENLDNEENFVCLNESTHSVVHFLRDSRCGWRHAIMALIEIMKTMDRLSDANSRQFVQKNAA